MNSAAAILAFLPALQEGEASPRPFVILETREVRDLLGEADRHLAASRTVPALGALQTILDEYPNHLVASPESRSTFLGAWLAADRRIASLPPPGREAYEAAFGPKAAASLRLARERGDVEAIRGVANRYGNTLAGLSARISLGDLAFLRGNLEAARREYERALVRADPDRRPSLLARLAVTLRLLGDGGAVESLAGSLAGDATRSVEVAGAAIPLRDLLAEAGGTGRRPSREALPGFSIGREFTPRPQWSYRVPMEPFAPPFHARGLWGYGVPNMIPTVADGIVLLSDSLRVRALDLLNGRRELWSFRGAPEWEQAAASGRVDVADYFLALRESTLVQPAAAAGVVVEALQVLLKRPSDSIEMFQGIPIRTILPQRRLFAFDLRTGALLWSHWSPLAAQLDVGPFEVHATVAGPPVADAERAYAVSVLYQGKVDLYLSAYSLRTGREQWRTRLIFGQIETNMFGRPFREFSASPPLLADGSLFLSTNLGAVARLEAETGRVEWLTLYDPLQIPKPRFHEQIPREVYWANGPPVLSGDLLHVAPLDSDRVLVLDAADGTIRTVITPRQIADALGDVRPRHLVGTIEDRLLLVGGQAAAFRFAREIDGRVRAELAWKEFVADAEGLASMPRPVLLGDHLLLPGSDGPVVLDALNGNRVQREIYWDVRHEHRGNLVVADGALLSTSATSVNAFFDWDAVLNAAREREGEPEALARLLLQRGEARLGEGNALSALVDLREADRLLAAGSGRRPATHFQVLMALAEAERQSRASVGAVAATMGRAVAAAPDPPRRMEGLLALLDALHAVPGSEAEVARIEAALLAEFAEAETEAPGRGRIPVGLHVLLRRADAREASGDRADAIEALRDASARFGRVFVSEQRVTELVSERIGAIVAAAPEAFRREFDREAVARLEAARRSGEASALERLARDYPATGAELEARLALGELFLERRDFERSWSYLRKVVLAGEPGLEARSWRRIAALADAVGNGPFARTALARAAEVGGAAASDWPADAGAALGSLRPVPKEPADPPPGPPEDLARLPEANFQSGEIRLLEILGEDPAEAGLLLVFDGSTLTLYRPAEKGLVEPEWQRSLRDDRQPPRILADLAVVTGSRILIVVDGTLRGLDLETGEDALPARALAEPPQGSRDVVYGEGVLLLRSFDRRRGIVWNAFEASTGTPIWTLDLDRAYPDPPLVADGEAIWIPASTWAEEPILRHDLLSGSLRASHRLPNLLTLVDGSRALACAGALLLPVAEPGSRGSVSITAVPLDGGPLASLRPSSEGTFLLDLLPDPLGPIAVFAPRDGAPRGTTGEVTRVAVQAEGRFALSRLFSLPAGSVLAGLSPSAGRRSPLALLVVPEGSSQFRLALHDLASGEVLWRRGTSRTPAGLGHGLEPPAFLGGSVVALVEEDAEGRLQIAALSRNGGSPLGRFPLPAAPERAVSSVELVPFGERLLVRTGAHLDLFGERR